MIKINSFTNFESFNDKPGSISDSESDASSEDFTAILSSFTPVQTVDKLLTTDNAYSGVDDEIVPESTSSQATSPNFETYAENVNVENKGEVSNSVLSGVDKTRNTVVDYKDSSLLDYYETLDPIFDNTRPINIADSFSPEIGEVKLSEQTDIVENTRVNEQSAGEFQTEINESSMPQLIVPETDGAKDSVVDPKGTIQFGNEKSADLHCGLPIDPNLETRGQRPLGPRKIETKEVNPRTIELEPRGQCRVGPSKIEAHGNVSGDDTFGGTKPTSGFRFLIDSDNILDIPGEKGDFTITSTNDKNSILNFDSLLSEDVEIIDVRNALEAEPKIRVDSMNLAKDKGVNSLTPFENGVSKSTDSKYADRSSYQSLFNDRSILDSPVGYTPSLLERLGEKSGILETGLVNFPTFNSNSRLGETSSANSTALGEFNVDSYIGERLDQYKSNSIPDSETETSSEPFMKTQTPKPEMIHSIETNEFDPDFESTSKMKISGPSEITAPIAKFGASDLFSGYEFTEAIDSGEPKIGYKPMTESQVIEQAVEVDSKLKIADSSLEPTFEANPEIKITGETKDSTPIRDLRTVLPDNDFQVKPEIRTDSQIPDFHIDSERSTNKYAQIDEVADLKSSEPVKYYESDASEPFQENSEISFDTDLESNRLAKYFDSDLNSVKSSLDRAPYKIGESITGQDRIHLKNEVKQTIGEESVPFESKLTEAVIFEPKSVQFEMASLTEAPTMKLPDLNAPAFEQAVSVKDGLSEISNVDSKDFSELRTDDQTVRTDRRSVVINKEIAVVSDNNGKLSMPLFAAERNATEKVEPKPISPIEPVMSKSEKDLNPISNIAENDLSAEIQKQANVFNPEPSLLATRQTQTVPIVQVTNSLTRLYSKIARIFRDDRAAISTPSKAGSKPGVGFGTVQSIIAPESSTFELRDNRAGSTHSSDNEVSRNNTAESLRDGFDFSKKLNGKASYEVASPLVESLSSISNPVLSNTLPQSQVPISPAMNNEIRVAPAEKLERKSGLSGQSSLELSGVNFERFIKSATTPNESVSLDSLIKDQVVGKQIEPKIIEMAEFLKSNEEKQLIKLRLKPTELGEVEIRIERDSVGNIRAHFHTTSETTRHILSESLGQLRDSLQNSGLKVESLEVSSNPQPSAGNEKGDQQSRHGERFERVGNDATFSNIENEDESQEDPAQRLVNLRA